MLTLMKYTRQFIFSMHGHYLTDSLRLNTSLCRFQVNFYFDNIIGSQTSVLGILAYVRIAIR
jgi:hypothetical protein